MLLLRQRRSFGFRLAWQLVGAVSLAGLLAGSGAEAEAAGKRRIKHPIDQCSVLRGPRWQALHKPRRPLWWGGAACRQHPSGLGDKAKQRWGSSQDAGLSGDDGGDGFDDGSGGEARDADHGNGDHGHNGGGGGDGGEAGGGETENGSGGDSSDNGGGGGEGSGDTSDNGSTDGQEDGDGSSGQSKSGNDGKSGKGGGSTP